MILRKKQGISQQELADYLKISVTSYGQKER
ncbi:helix-turn-helix domain-containing protein, partial [Streptococcus pneumoniae]